MGSSTSRATRRRRPATRTGWRPRCAFQAIDSLPSEQPKTNTSVFGEAERQGHESELDEPATVGAALESIQEGRAGSPPALRRVITLRHAVAIYVSSLLGSGIFVIPGLAARIAGPASIVSWMLLSLASYPFAYTFAKLSAKRPESGGIYAFARDGIGLSAGAATAWLFLAWAVLGAPAATVAAASYLAFVFPLTRLDIYLAAPSFLISGLYLAIAVVTVGTGAYTAGGGATPFAAMMSDAFGSYGGAIVALLAVFVTFGTVNAYVAGMARVYYAAARDGVFPRTLATVDRRTGVPAHALVFLIVFVLVSLLAFYLVDVDFVTAFLLASGAAVLTYVIGSVAGIRLLKERGMRRALPRISLPASVRLLPFLGVLLAASVAIAGVGLLASWILSRRGRGAVP